MCGRSAMGDDMTKREKAIKVFCKNEYWREYYEGAPSEACKEWIELQFCYSMFREPENIGEKHAVLEKDFTIEDWEHLRKYAGHNPFYSRCTREIKRLKEQADA